MKSIIIIIAVALSGLAGSAAQAQTSTQNADADPTRATATDGTSLEEIVITAQRRSQNLQDVPIVVEAVSGIDLINSGVENVQDLRDVVPGVNVTSSEGFETTHLRGVGSTAVGPGLENPIALYVDGVYYASTQSSVIDFVDVAQVEVLKGPQGTLFGRNATGGLIQVTTKEPTQDDHIDAHIGYGNYQTEKADLSVSGGITSDLAAGLAIQAGRQGEGYGKNLNNNEDVYKNFGDLTVRSKWVWVPADLTKVTTIFDYSQSRNNDLVDTLVPGKQPVVGTGPVMRGGPWDTDTDTNNYFHNKSGGASIRLDQDLSVLHLMNLAAYRQSLSGISFDIDATPTPFEDLAGIVTKEHQLSEELQATSLAGSAVTWAGGLYYFKYDGSYAPEDVHFGGVPVDPIAPFNDLLVYGTQKISSVAPYGQATMEILTATNLTLGIRYTHESRELTGYTYGQIEPGIPLVELGPTDMASKDFSKVTYRVSIDHRFSPEALGYLSYNTGFKSGGFNPGSPGDPAFSPESLGASEIGVKTDLFDRRVRANVAAFYYDYKDIQIQRVELSSTGLVNGAGAKIYGVDFDSEAQIGAGLKMTGGFEYLHDDFTNFPNAPVSSPLGGLPLTTGSATGNRLPWTPNFVGTLGLEHTLPLGSSSLHSSLSYSYNSGYFVESDNVLRQHAYNNLNATLRWQSAGDRYSVGIWGNNLTDAVVANTLQTPQIGSPYRILNPPRIYGITFGYHY